MSIHANKSVVDLLGRLLLAVLTVGVLTGIAVDSHASSQDVREASVATDDPCESECPGESPDGDCEQNCQYCGCCSAAAASTLVPSSIATHPRTPPSGDVLAAPPTIAPTGVTHGVFKPPRRLSA
jgi:hypothetical protein